MHCMCYSLHFPNVFKNVVSEIWPFFILLDLFMIHEIKKINIKITNDFLNSIISANHEKREEYQQMVNTLYFISSVESLLIKNFDLRQAQQTWVICKKYHSMVRFLITGCNQYKFLTFLRFSFILLNQYKLYNFFLFFYFR